MAKKLTFANNRWEEVNPNADTVIHADDCTEGHRCIATVHTEKCYGINEFWDEMAKDMCEDTYVSEPKLSWINTVIAKMYR